MLQSAKKSEIHSSYIYFFYKAQIQFSKLHLFCYFRHFNMYVNVSIKLLFMRFLFHDHQGIVLYISNNIFFNEFIFYCAYFVERTLRASNLSPLFLFFIILFF